MTIRQTHLMSPCCTFKQNAQRYTFDHDDSLSQFMHNSDYHIHLCNTAQVRNWGGVTVIVLPPFKMFVHVSRVICVT